MSHEERLRYFDEEVLNELEAIEASGTAIVSQATARVAALLGHRLEVDGERVVIHAP